MTHENLLKTVCFTHTWISESRLHIQFGSGPNSEGESDQERNLFIRNTFFGKTVSGNFHCLRGLFLTSI